MQDLQKVYLEVLQLNAVKLIIRYLEVSISNLDLIYSGKEEAPLCKTGHKFAFTGQGAPHILFPWIGDLRFALIIVAKPVEKLHLNLC